MTFIAPHYRKAKKKARLNFLKNDRYLVKTPWWLKKLYPGCVWDMPEKEKTLYLTFDDGPHPTITPFVLQELKKYNAKATFFCIGKNVAKYPDVFQQVIDEGHAAGNHSFHHINGWKTSTSDYTNDIKKADEFIHSNLFRPPYGRITRSQIKKLRSGAIAGCPLSVVMWNILAGDWDETVNPEKCYERIKNKITAGDIIVFHDSEKAWDRMRYCLPRLMADFSQKGYKFEIIK